LHTRTNRRHFIFIAGAEGSGTTLMSRLLAAPQTCASLGGLYYKIPPSEEAQRLVEEFRSAGRLTWDRKISFAEHLNARENWKRAWQRILACEAFTGVTHFVFKRSFPFATPREQFVPYLWDIDDLIGQPLFVIMYRNPCAAVYSTLRRGFDTDLRRLAVLCSEQLTNISAQAQTIDESRLKVVSYKDLCMRPSETIEPLLGTCALDREQVLSAVARELPTPSVDDRYRRELGTNEVTCLEQFFDKRRRKQWNYLKERSGED
jgi:hypothetical protein